ncbi:MAG: hypothetical protein AAGE76_03595 [Pseudomonadota bacterium]
MIGAFRHRSLARQALSLLKREREALLSGDVSAIAPISRKLSQVADNLLALPPTEDRTLGALLVEVRDAAERNRALVASSQKGFQAALRLYEEMTAVKKQFETYTGRGDKRDILSPRSTNDRRT